MMDVQLPPLEVNDHADEADKCLDDNVATVSVSVEASVEDAFEERLEGGDDDDPECCPYLYTKGPCGCILMLFFSVVALFCWAFGFALRAFVCIVTCPCPGSCACNTCADCAAYLISIPAKMGKCIAGICPC
eukprot:jgi/Bigna1/59873/fgenesh1_kg.7_\